MKKIAKPRVIGDAADAEPMVRRGEAARRRKENRERHKELSREGQLKRMRKLQARQRDDGAW